MDIRMPELDGLEATRRILAADAGARILVLTTFDLDEYVYEALQAGASGFVLKDDPPEQLLAAIRTVGRGPGAALAGGHEARDPRVHAHPPAGRAEGARRADRARAGGALADRRGRSNAEIGEALFISETTVKTHVTHVLQKLDVRDRVQAVVLAYQAGLVEAGSDPGAEPGPRVDHSRSSNQCEPRSASATCGSVWAA